MGGSANSGPRRTRTCLAWRITSSGGRRFLGCTASVPAGTRASPATCRWRSAAMCAASAGPNASRTVIKRVIATAPLRKVRTIRGMREGTASTARRLCAREKGWCRRHRGRRMAPPCFAPMAESATPKNLTRDANALEQATRVPSASIRVAPNLTVLLTAKTVGSAGTGSTPTLPVSLVLNSTSPSRLTRALCTAPAPMASSELTAVWGTKYVAPRRRCSICAPTVGNASGRGLTRRGRASTRAIAVSGIPSLGSIASTPPQCSALSPRRGRRIATTPSAPTGASARSTSPRPRATLAANVRTTGRGITASTGSGPRLSRR
mmetsp:Transcript_48200/g.145606  ORF Transcript_48200/g.145606 Transcript_48200/m.145606 type:complete len:321 (-) Transcript_48200:549-1511(-)